MREGGGKARRIESEIERERCEKSQRKGWREREREREREAQYKKVGNSCYLP